MHTALLGDWMTNLAPKVTDILNDGSVDVLVYSGDKDFICNWRGGEAWTDGCSWTGQKDFQKEDYKKWQGFGRLIPNGVDVRWLSSRGPLHRLIGRQ